MKTDKILLDHGSGGKISHRLIGEIMLPLFDNPILSALNDGAIFDIKGNRDESIRSQWRFIFFLDPTFFLRYKNSFDCVLSGYVAFFSLCQQKKKVHG